MVEVLCSGVLPNSVQWSDIDSFKMTTGEYLHYRNWQMLQITLSHPFPTAAMTQAG